MRNFKLFLAIVCLHFAFLTNAQTLTFRMANPAIKYFNGVGNYFSFDIQVMASDPNTYMWVGQAKMSFNSVLFSSVSTDWIVTPKALISGTYPKIPTGTGDKFLSTVQNVSGGAFTVGWTANAAVSGYTPQDIYHNKVPVTWESVVNVLVKMTGSVSEVATMSFIHSAMDNQEQFHTGINTNSNYTVAYSDEFTDLYVGRIFANGNWTQVNTTSPSDWTASVATSVWDGAATIPAGSLSLASNIRIHNPATLTIPATGQLTVSGNTEINAPNALILQSDATSAASLITAAASGNGSAVVQRYMAPASWRIATSPVSDQTIAGFLGANATIATNNSNHNLRGMTDYMMASNTWNPFFDQTSVTGTIQVGKGYMLRATTAGAGPVSFTGSLNAATTSVALSTTGTGWNCVGNPFTSAITKADIINYNAGAFQSGYEALYIYNGSTYDIVNLAQGQNTIQSGQGFFVKAASATNLSFTTTMKVHDNGQVLKSGKITPEIQLIAKNDDKTATTLIKFMDGTSNGLDEGYDAGIFKSETGLNIYTRLVEDNGIDFGLQCLPANQLDNVIIPVGIDSKAGGEVEFSARGVNTNDDFKMILEDKQNNTFTDLSDHDYKTTLDINSSTSDRFQLHTSYQTTGLNGDFLKDKLSAYAVRNTEIRLKGTVSSQAVATLYDVLGKAVLVKNLEEGSLNIIPTPNLHTGIYLLSVKDNGRVQGFKIPVSE
ncbi:MAG TPA: T9SS type A sorting domain-containing protein [Prolixibacteraceae bacterium]|nr:T9SS type A sorting domain-containing protein [Prolixibacteraceae bacterium]